MRKQFLKSMLLALLCVVGGVTSAWADDTPYTITSTESSYVDATSDETKAAIHNGSTLDNLIAYNTQTRNWVNGDATLSTKFNANGRMALYKFPLAAVKNATGNLKSVTLKVTINSTGDGKDVSKVGIFGYNGSQDWTGATLTYNTLANNGAKALGYTVDYSGSFAILDENKHDYSGKNTTWEASAVTYFQSAIDAGRDYISFAVTNNSARVANLSTKATLEVVYTTDEKYTVNAMAGETLLQTIASGFAAEGEEYSFMLSKVVEKDGKFYVLDENTAYKQTFTMGNSTALHTFNYTEDPSIVYFKEAEAITSAQNLESESCSGGKYVSFYAGPTSVTIAEPGTYQLEANIVDRTSNSSLEVYTADGTTSVALIPKNVNVGINTCNFTVEEANTVMRVGGPYYNNKFQNSNSFDYVLIRKLYNYTVNGVDADGNVLYEVAKGTGVYLSSPKVPYHTYFNNNGALLKADKIDNNKNEYNYTFALDADPTVKTITYKATDITEGLVFLTEAEDIEGATPQTGKNANIRCSMSTGASFSADTKITTLSPGKYTITAQIWGNSGTTFTIKAGDTQVWSLETKGYLTDATSEEFTLVEETDITIVKGGDNGKMIDLVYIVKTGEASDDAILAAAKTSLQSLIAEAEALDAEGLADAISKANTALIAQDATVKSLESAKTALQQAIDAWKASKMFMGETGKYYLKNVASRKFLGAGNSWGTQASLIAHPEYLKLNKLNDGKYNIDSQVSNGGDNHYFNGSFMDNNSPLELTIAKSGDYYTISGNIVDDQTKQTVLRYFGYDGQSTVLAALEESGNNALWQIFSEAEMLATLSTATADVPADATFMILDQGFGRNNRNETKVDDNNWTGVWSMTATNQNLSGGNNVNNCAESYHATFTLTQTISGAPKGVYALTAQGFYRQDGSDNANLPYFYAKGADDEATANFPLKTGSENSMNDASVSFTEGNYTIDPILFEVGENGTFEVGAKNQNTSLWCIWDNFVLSYLGNSTEAYAKLNAILIAQVEALKAEAQQRLQNEAVQGREALTAAITAANGALQSADKADLKDAITALKEAIAHDKAYITAAEAIAKAKALKEAHNFATAEATTTFAEAIAAIETPFNAGTLSDADAQNALISLGLTAVGWHEAATNTPAANYMRSAWPENFTVNDWSVEGASDGSNFLVPFFQDWIGDANSLGKKTWTGTLTGLENGLYKVSAWVRVRAKNETAVTDATGITIDVNGGTAVDATEGTQIGNTQFQLDTYEAEGLVKDGKLSLSFNIAADNNISWLSFKNVKYTKVRDLREDEMGVTAEELAAFDEALTNAKGVDQTKKMNAEVLATLQKAIAANVDRNDRAAVVSATNTLNDAAENANKSIAAYTAINDAMVAASETATEKLDEAGAATFNDEIANLEGAYNNGTLTSMDDDNVATKLANALATGAKAQTTPNADMTLAIINNSFETGDLTGWILKKNSSDTGVKDNTGNYATTGIDGNKLFNTWWQGVPLQQTITELPAGSYKLSALIASGDDNADAKIFLTVNDNRQLFTRPAGSKGTFADCSMIFALSEKSNVTIGIVGGTDNGEYVENGHWWYKADNFRLQKISSTIGDGTPSLANGSYTQQNTLDISFNPVAISNADVFAILDAEKITVNSKQAQATLEGNKLTVTLADLLSTGTEYVVTLAAGAVGYSAQNANSEQTFTVKTPALFDGTYYIATNEEQPRYISRGGDSQTEAALDRYGIAAKFTTDAENVTHVTFVDNNKNLFGGSQSIYTDKTEADLRNDAARARFTIEQGQNGFAFYNLQWNKYIAAGTGAESGAQAAVYADEPYYWNLMNAATHAQLLATYKDQNALAVAEAAGLTNVATAAQLNEAITADGWMSKNIELAESYSAVTESFEYKNNAPAIIAEQQLTGLEQGIYKVSLSGFHRMASNDATYELNKQLLDGSTTYLWANDQQLQFPSVMSEGADVAYTEGDNPNYAKDDKNYPNSKGAAGQAFSNGLYTIEVFAYVGEDGKLSLGATAPAKYTNSNWICWRDLKVTYYTDFVGDYSHLKQTVATCENYKLGFEADEYAPYQNAEKLIALKQAQALLDNCDATTQTEIDALNTTLSTGWTANSEEVNAIFDGSFAREYSHDGNVQPLAWTGSDGHNTATDVRLMWNAESNAGLNKTSTHQALFTKFGAFYGKEEGYTMPLKANTTYEISFVYGGWGDNAGQCSKDGYITISDAQGNTITITPERLPLNNLGAQSSTDNWESYRGYFTTGEAGNYVLGLRKDREASNSQSQYVYGDFMLKRAVAEDITIAETEGYTPAARYGNVTFKRTLVEGWNGLAVPFDMTIDEAKSVFNATEVKTFTGIKLNNDETVTLCFGNANSVKAGVPFLIKVSKADKSYEIGTMLLSDNAAVKPVTYTAEGNENIKYTMQSSYKAETNLTDVVFALIQGNKFFYHNTGNPSSAKAFRAWFVNESTDAEAAARLRFDLGDDETTGIKSIANDADSLTATYDLQGRAVKTAAKKGLYIKNGKKMVVK